MVENAKAASDTLEKTSLDLFSEHLAAREIPFEAKKAPNGIDVVEFKLNPDIMLLAQNYYDGIVVILSFRMHLQENNSEMALQLLSAVNNFNRDASILALHADFNRGVFMFHRSVQLPAAPLLVDDESVKAGLEVKIDNLMSRIVMDLNMLKSSDLRPFLGGA